MSQDPGTTTHLLERWHSGDDRALEVLLERHLDWIRRQVSRRLGPVLRAKGETQDFVQESLLEVFHYAPRFVVEDETQFRRLLARIIENVLRDQHDYFTARRRALDRECPLPSDTVLSLDAPVQKVPQPGQVADHHETRALVRLALELIDPADRRVLLWRLWEDRGFRDIGAELSISEDAARMRVNRALLRLTRTVEKLERGELGALLDEPRSGAGP
jgi:RNA polymerase sigma factor (sigma-70 family)